MGGIDALELDKATAEIALVIERTAGVMLLALLPA
jgi:hypothetical protein